MSYPKEYLGDGAYVQFDGWALVLTAENGIEATDTIVLEPTVWQALTRYVERLKQRRAVEPVGAPEPPAADSIGKVTT